MSVDMSGLSNAIDAIIAKVDRLEAENRKLKAMGAYLDELPEGFDIGDDATVEMAVELTALREAISSAVDILLRATTKVARHD